MISPDGHARFTFLTEHVFRMEYSKVENQFEDRPSIAFLNRNTNQNIEIIHTINYGSLIITTPTLVIIYKLGTSFLECGSMTVIGREVGHFKRWESGMKTEDDPGNLLGTFRTLD